MKNGFFITFEGCEGSGKSTQSTLLKQYLTKKGYKVISTREPGGTPISECIRNFLLYSKKGISPLTELFLFEAGRVQHVEDIVMPAVKSGKTVICDRYIDATFAYQGFGRGLDTDIIMQLNLIASKGMTPDLTIYLDIPPAKGLIKAKKVTNGKYDRLESEKLSFHKKVQNGYLSLAKSFPSRIKVVKTCATIDETHKNIIEIVKRKLKI